MRTIMMLVLSAVPCIAPRILIAEEVINGQKFQALLAAPDSYFERPVVLEDTFNAIVQGCTRIERQNYLTPDRFVKFKMGQCPYPCIGLRTGGLDTTLMTCSKGDLVRVTGMLQKITENRVLMTERQKRPGGLSWEDRYYVHGPLKSEYYFNVGSVQKGWGSQDSLSEMFSEGKNLDEIHYQEVRPADLSGDVGKLTERALWFQGSYAGLDENLNAVEKSAGMMPDKIIKFKVDRVTIPCYIQKDESNLEGFKKVSLGSTMQVYGRIRAKETDQGKLVGFFVDRVTRTVKQ